MIQFDFLTVHKQGKEHVIPDTLSRLPISSEGSQLIMLPPDVSSFLIASLSLEMEYQPISNTQDNFFLPFICLNLACQTSVISHSPCHKEASKTSIVCYSTKPPSLSPSKDINTKPQINDSPPPTHSFAPLSIGRYEFIEEQRRKDKCLNLKVEYITNECQLSTLKGLSNPTGGGGHSIVKNTGGWLDSLGSGILVGKRYFGVLQNIGLDNS